LERKNVGRSIITDNTTRGIVVNSIFGRLNLDFGDVERCKLGKQRRSGGINDMRNTFGRAPKSPDYAIGEHRAWEVAVHTFIKNYQAIKDKFPDLDTIKTFSLSWFINHTWADAEEVTVCPSCSEEIANALLEKRNCWACPEDLKEKLAELLGRHKRVLGKKQKHLAKILEAQEALSRGGSGGITHPVVKTTLSESPSDDPSFFA
jgi:hypothetical protein